MFQKDEKIVVYLVKYALTEGIKKMSGSVYEDKTETGGCVFVDVSQKSYRSDLKRYDPKWHTRKESRDLALTESEALEMAEVMRADRIKSLEKSIIKTKNMVFKIKQSEEEK